MLLFRFVIIILFSINICNVAISDTVTVSEDKTQSSDTSVQQNIDTDDVTLTVSGNAQVDDDAKAVLVDAGVDGASVIVESGSTITTTSGDNGILSLNTTNLSVSNSGTISTNAYKAIDVYRSSDASITNESGATISAVGNTLRIGGSSADNSTGITITNSGKIFSTSAGVKSSVIFGNTNNSGTTITNNAGAEIYSGGDISTIKVGSTATITNRGSIKNNTSPSDVAIDLLGNNNTVKLEEGSILVGKISSASGKTGNTLKLNLGVGQGYFYETSGDLTLQDLDGNQVVKGSAGSVGQGGSETLDELLSYKSMNLRQFFNNYNKQNIENDWGTAYASNLKRDGHASNLAIEYDLINIGVNLISQMKKASFVITFEGGSQDFVKDHKIKYKNITSGIYLPQKNNSYFNLDAFILGGITLKQSERTILTNTTTSGKLDIDGDYETYEIHTGIRKNNLSIIPDLGLAASYSFTPNYEEAKYFSWNDRHIGNISIFFSDDYNLINNNSSNLFLGWTLDFRNLIGEKKQAYLLNGTKATYNQDNDLTKEVSLLANIGYKKKFSNNSDFSISLDAKDTNQLVKSIGANISLSSRF